MDSEDPFNYKQKDTMKTLYKDVLYDRARKVKGGGRHQAIYINKLNSVRLLVLRIMIRNFHGAALIVELLIPSGVIDVHELTITQHYILTILIPFDGLLHFKPSGRRYHKVIMTVLIYLLKEL